jgi:hypothetical protein
MMPSSLYRTRDCWDASLLATNPYLRELLTPPKSVPKVNYSFANLNEEHQGLARRLLTPWLKTGIRRGDIDANSVASKDFDKDDALFVQYINKTLYISKVTNHKGSNDKHFLSYRRKHGVYAIHDAISQRKDIGDFELYLGVSDSPIKRGLNFGLVAASEKSRTLPLSQSEWDFTSNDDWNRTLEEVFKWRDSHPWNERSPKAIFRGGGGSCFPPYGDENAVNNASLRSLLEKGKLSCGRNALRHASETCAAGMVDLSNDFVSLKDQEKAKYIIYAEGHQGWANRLKYYLGMGNAIVMQLNRGGKEWYSMLGMEPWVHYIPVDHLFNSLPAVLQWAREHDKMVQDVSANADAYARHYLSEASFRSYVEELLIAYSNLFQYTPILESRASNFDEYLKVKHNLDGDSMHFSEWPSGYSTKRREETAMEKLEKATKAAELGRDKMSAEHREDHKALRSVLRKEDKEVNSFMLLVAVLSVISFLSIARRIFRNRR